LISKQGNVAAIHAVKGSFKRKTLQNKTLVSKRPQDHKILQVFDVTREMFVMYLGNAREFVDKSR
jgi:hypothetical protein